MATTARLLPSIKPQMALQTLPQFIFQGALRDHHLENNKSEKLRGEQRALKSLPNVPFNNRLKAHHRMRSLDISQVDFGSGYEGDFFQCSTCLKFFRPQTRSSLFYPPSHPPHTNIHRPESDLKQLSKSGMTDKFIFSSWVYIPGICTADLALTSARSLQAVF